MMGFAYFGIEGGKEFDEGMELFGSVIVLNKVWAKDMKTN